MTSQEIANYAFSKRKVVIVLNNSDKILGTFQRPLQPSINKWGFSDRGTSLILKGHLIARIDYFDDANPVTGEGIIAQTKK